MTINDMRLCERLNLNPDQLENAPLNKVMDWLTILRYESEIEPKAGQQNG